MRTLLISLAACLGLSITASAAETFVVNIDALTDTISNPEELVLGAGTYSIEYTNSALNDDADFTAWNAWRNERVGGCNGDGADCRYGYLYGVSYAFGDTVVNISNGPRFSTPELAFANAPDLAPFTLSEETTVSFYIRDSNYADNSNGISLAIRAVPEPATWLMMLAGFAMTGLALKRRKVAVAA